MKTVTQKLMQAVLTTTILLAALNAAKADERDDLAFPSEVPGLNIQNASFVNASGVIIRGATPIGKASELALMGITDVVIFKNQTRDEVDKEITELQDAGISNIHHQEFLWKEVTNQRVACEQTIAALKVLVEVEQSTSRKAFFHCTAGQDRTGYLAGLYRLLTEDISREQAIAEELCANGYSEGNVNKPAKVVYLVNESLSPLFVKMASLIESGKISADNLDAEVCGRIRVSKKPLRLCR
jgi:hypothetical protein